jgi:hypothetical protein
VRRVLICSLFLFCEIAFCMEIKPLGAIIDNSKRFLLKAMVLEDYYLLVYNNTLELYEKTNFKLVKQAKYTGTRYDYSYYCKGNEYVLMDGKQETAVKYNELVPVKKIAIKTPKDWYMFCDQVFADYFRIYNNIGGEVIDSYHSEVIIDRFKYRFNLAHDSKNVYMIYYGILQSIESTWTGKWQITEYLGQSPSSYCFYGVFDEVYVVTSLISLGLEAIWAFNIRNNESYYFNSPEFFGMDKNLAYSNLRVSVYKEELYLFSQLEEKVQIYKVSFK